MPTSAYGEPAVVSARATPAACVSPDASPATNRISRTGDRGGTAGQRGKRALDVLHDLQRDRERLAPRLAADGDRRLAAHRRHEAVERQQRDALDELLQRERRRRERRNVDVAAQPEELSVAAAEIEREISALLEDAQLPHPLAR